MQTEGRKNIWLGHLNSKLCARTTNVTHWAAFVENLPKLVISPVHKSKKGFPGMGTSRGHFFFKMGKF